MRMTCLCLVAAGLAGTAVADTQAADACAAKLSGPQKEIYAAVVAGHPTKDTARGMVVSEVEKLVKAGTLSSLDARSAGEAAGDCLKLLE